MIESKLIPLLLLPFSSRFPSLAQIRTIRGKDKAGKMAVHVHRYERKMIVLDYDLTPTHPMKKQGREISVKITRMVWKI